MNGAEFRATIKKYMELRNINGFKGLLEDKTLGSFPTFRRKWDNPEMFTIYEIDYLIRKLNVRSCDRAVLKGESDKATPLEFITEKGVIKKSVRSGEPDAQIFNNGRST